MGRLRFAFGKLLFTFAFGLSTFVLGADANAGVQWCESDPVFLVNGAIVDVTTGFPANYTSTLKGAVAYEVLVPSNAVALVVSLPANVAVSSTVIFILTDRCTGQSCPTAAMAVTSASSRVSDVRSSARNAAPAGRAASAAPRTARM